MACPFFFPDVRLETNSWIVPPRLPLGDPYTGECRARETVYRPDEARLRENCNVGYCRDRCDRFPPEAPADAIRFHIAGETNSLIQIQFVFEKDCWPQSHGRLELGCAARVFTSGPEGVVLRKQALAFAESYLRRRD